MNGRPGSRDRVTRCTVRSRAAHRGGEGARAPATPAALRKGLHLRKSSKLDPDHPEFGKWWVVAPPKDRPELWRWLGRELTPRDGVTLEQAAAFVEGYRPQRVPPDMARQAGPVTG